MMYNIDTVIDEIIANKFIDLGKAYQKRKKYTLSKKSYHNALQLREKLLAVDFEKYAPLVIETLQSLATLYKEKDEIDYTIEYYRKIITITRSLYQNTSQLNYASLLAITMTKIAKLHIEYYNNHELGLYFHNEALTLYTTLLENEEYLHNRVPLLETHISLAIIYQKMNMFQKSEKHYLNALSSCELLIASGVANHVDKLGMIHSDLATLYFTNNHEINAKENYLLALEILTHSPKKELHLFRETIAIIQNNLANIYASNKKYTKAQLYFRAALQHFIALADEFPALYIDFVTTLFKNLALLYFDQGEHKKAEFFHLQSIKIYEEFIQYDAEKYSIQLASAIIDGVQYYGQHSLSLYRAESILRAYGWYDKAEVLLGKICKLKSENVKEFV